MDQQRFDAALRALGRGASRRAAMAGVLGALVGARLGDDAAAGGAKAGGGGGRRKAADPGTGKRRRRPGAAGPCGDGSRKENRCTSDRECCTRVCNLKAGKGNQDGQGRCRCVRRGKGCTQDRNCCNMMKCVAGVCDAGGGGTDSGGVTVTDGNSLQQAIDSAPDGATIDLPPGTYAKDLKITRSITLRGGSAGVAGLRDRGATAAADNTVVLQNETDGARVIETSGAGVTLMLENITVTRNPSGERGGGILAKDGAGLVLIGTTVVKDAKPLDFVVVEGGGGGVELVNAGPSRIAGDTRIVDNVVVQKDYTGGGVWASGTVLVIEERAVISGNSADDGGGAEFRDSTVTIQGTVSVDGNTAVGSSAFSGSGGGIMLQATGTLTITGDATVTGNTATKGGGGIFAYGATVLAGNATVTANTISGGNGGGVAVGYNTEASLTVSENAVISGNSVTGTGICANYYSYALTTCVTS